MGGLVACASDEGATAASSSPTVAPSSATPASTLEAWTPAPQPSLDELYRPKADIEGLSVRRVGPTRVPPPGIDTANEEAAVWLGRHPYQGPIPASFAGAAGSEERRCIEVDDSAARTRSGDFVLDLTRWLSPDWSFEVLPVASSRRYLLLRALFLDDLGVANPATHVHEYDGFVEWNSTEEVLYAPRFVLPRAGRWMVVATAGPVWGCFILEAPEPPPGFEVVSSIEGAEAAGARFPSMPPPQHLSPAFGRERGPGVIESPGGYTIDGTGIHDARAGEWIARGASSYEGDWEPSLAGSKVLLFPLHQPQSVERVPGGFGREERLTLTSTLLDDPRHTYVYEQPVLNAYTGSAEAGTREFSHVASFVHPRAGRWVAVATSGKRGADWGCFVLDLR